MRRWILFVCVCLLPGLGAWIKWTEPASKAKTEDKAVAAAPVKASILGLWSRFSPEKEGDLQRFYYFHTGGIGLFRYGKMGLTYTQTFGYRVSKDRIELVFNKSGDKHSVRFKVEGNALTLMDDPKMGGTQTYTKRGVGSVADVQAFDHPFARLWTQTTKDKAGRMGFHMYQLQAPTIDGRGVGWYHEGDFAEWSTETLQYRRTGNKLALYFPVRDESHVTELTEGDSEGVRTLSLGADPRNYWHPRTYRDGGPGFTMHIDDLPMPYHVPGHGAAGGSSCPHGH